MSSALEKKFNKRSTVHGDELCSFTTDNCSLVSKLKINLVCFEEKT